MNAQSVQARELLKSVFGYDAFRVGQDEILNAVFAGENVLAIMPTGSGKSLCYQLPALVLDGLTVVISPLIALMRDQVKFLVNSGIAAASLNSANSEAENDETYRALRAGRLKLLYVSPERLAVEGMAAFLKRLGVSLVAVDEAHCISQWGHDFRPEYMKIRDVVEMLGEVQVIALTATADAATRKDIETRLFGGKARVFLHGFDRPNIYLSFQPKAAKRQQVLNFLAEHRGESGIVYCASRQGSEDLAAHLDGQGYKAFAYHAGLPQHLRALNQDRFLQEDGVVIAATVAFGMGINKPDVRFVCHLDMPKSIESYYQEIGRAGRDGLPAATLTLFGVEDMRLRRAQIAESTASEAQKRVEGQRLNALITLCEAPHCRRQSLLKYFGEDAPRCFHCDLCEAGVERYDASIEAQKAMSAILRTGQRFGTEHLTRLLVGERTEAIERLRHDLLPTFGVGRDRSVGDWRTIFRQLYALGLIDSDMSERAGWSVTEAGRAVLRGEEKLELRRDLIGRKSRADKRQRQKGIANFSADDAEIMRMLKGLRTQLAKEQNVPAYVIFPDRTLEEMVRLKPDSLVLMATVHGVGEAKLQRFGAEFLQCLRQAVAG
jgi:ATP-dependent DNA helicase RecQ